MWIALWTVLLATIVQPAIAAPLVHFTDIIADDSRTGFAGFEGAPLTVNLAQPWVERGIQVDALGPGGEEIATFCAGAPPPICQAHEGERSWYHNGGDSGYTQLTLTNGRNFQRLGLLVGSGINAPLVYANYTTLLDGVINSAGSFALPASGVSYLGFSGGQFDELWLSATDGRPAAPNSGTPQALQIDSIEVIPEPAVLVLVAMGVMGFGCRRRRRNHP